MASSSTIDRSAIFTAYNHARAHVASHQFERGRLNRALGLAMSKTWPWRRQLYHTTSRDCTCPDRQIRQVAYCKHMLALALTEKEYSRNRNSSTGYRRGNE